MTEETGQRIATALERLCAVIAEFLPDAEPQEPEEKVYMTQEGPI